MPLTPEQLARLQKANYKIIGKNKHSAVKLCHYTKASVKTGGEKTCYKQKFYGIRSHRCVQFTPTMTTCNLRCSYCWRDFRYFKDSEENLVDSPKDLVKEAIEAQKKLLTGLGGVEHSKKHLKEAMEPAHVAISLDGEPTTYPYLQHMIEEFHAHGMTTFLVTNGTYPERLETMNPLPTQLYVSLSANAEEMFVKTQHPTQGKIMWKNILRTLEILPTLNTRKVIRLTMVKNLNMESPEKYAELIAKAKPHFIEVKGWSAIGQSRERMPVTRMPTYAEVLEFCKELEKFLPDYKFTDSQEGARVGLLVNQKILPPPLYKKENFQKIIPAEKILGENNSSENFAGIPIVAN